MKGIALLLALALAAPAALALNMNGFKEAPLTRLTQDELKAFRAAVMKTLDESPDGATVEWKAPRTRFVSRITPRSTFTEGKLKCREAVVESDAQDRFQRGLYSFCKQANGEWQFKSRPTKK
jgi:surface antigen